MNDPIRLLTRYDAGEPWTLVSEEGLLLDGFATMCFQKMVKTWSPQKDNLEYDDFYCHMVVAHAFMEFTCLSGVNRIIEPSRVVFDWFCKLNGVPENLFDEAWTTYLED